MTRLIIIAILTFEIGILTSNCQNKLSYDFLISTNYCYRELKLNDDTAIFIIELRDKSEIAKISYKFGFAFNYHLKESYISLGLLFSNKGYQEKRNANDFVLPDSIHPFYGNLYSQNTTPLDKVIKNITFKYNYLYLDIPISYSYLFYDKKLKLFLSIGLQANFLVLAQNETIHYYSDDSKDKKYTNDKANYEKINFSIDGGLGIEFPISNKMNIIVEPYYKRNISTTIQAPIKQYLYSIGLNAKLRFRKK